MRVKLVFGPAAQGVYDAAGLRVRSNDPVDPDVTADLRATAATTVEQTASFTQGDLEPVDVLWVVDTSCSMAEPVGSLSAAVEAFFEPVLALGAGDWQMGVTTMDMSATGAAGRLVGSVVTPRTTNALDVFAAQINLPIDGGPDEQAFDAAKAALTLNEAPNTALVRASARLAVVVMSDEDDQSQLGAGAFSTWLKGLKPDPADVTFSALVPRPSQPCSIYGITAPRYHQVITGTGGVGGDFCDLDRTITPFLWQFTAVSAGLDVHFPLPMTPLAGGDAIDVEVDGQPVRSGWTWDAGRQAVQFWGSAIPQPGAAIHIRYEVAPTCPAP